MTPLEFEIKFGNYELDTEYADYIMAHGDNSERAICNGNMLTIAMEDGYLLDEFKASLTSE